MFYLSPLCAAIPPFWRILQCIRRYRDSGDKFHLVNAGKYSMLWFIIIFSTIAHGDTKNPVFYLWIAACIISTTYAYTWDIKRDWGIENLKIIRKRTIYPKPMYYVSIVLNFFLRCLWTLTVSPASLGIFLNPFIFATIIAVFEIFRRMQWNLYRLELEHLANLGKMRVTHGYGVLLENRKDKLAYVDWNNPVDLLSKLIPHHHHKKTDTFALNTPNWSTILPFKKNRDGDENKKHDEKNTQHINVKTPV